MRIEGFSLKLSAYLWGLTFALCLFGFGVSTVGVHMELTGAGHMGLYLIIFGPLIAGLSGITAQAASKYQAEGR